MYNSQVKAINFENLKDDSYAGNYSSKYIRTFT